MEEVNWVFESSRGENPGTDSSQRGKIFADR